jgi:hypothetical protein
LLSRLGVWREAKGVLGVDGFVRGRAALEAIRCDSAKIDAPMEVATSRKMPKSPKSLSPV